MYVQPVLHIPPEIEAGLGNGTLKLAGGVVRWAADGRIHKLLEEVDLPAPETPKALVAQLASAFTRKSALILAGGGIVLVGAAYAASYAKKRVAASAIAMPECLTKFEASLRAYVDAGRAGALTAAIVDELIVDLDSVKAFREEGNEVLISLDNLVPLFDLVIAHTPKLASAHGIDLNDLGASGPEKDGIVLLRRHLKAHRTILAETA